MWRAVLPRWSLAALVAALVGLVGTPASAQESVSGPLAVQLAELMASGELDAVAGQDPDEDDRFVAALAFPGQLLVVSARYEVPLYVRDKIAQSQFREVYIDLNAASIAGTKVQITDAGADGLQARGSAVDMLDAGQGFVRFDGDWGAKGMDEAEYQQTFRDADQQYARMLRALIAQAQ